MRDCGDPDRGIVELDHAAAVPVSLGGLKDDLADIDDKDGGPEPVDPALLPSLAGEENQQPNIDGAQAAVAGHRRIEPVDGGRNDDREADDREAAEPRVLPLQQASENDEKADVGNEVGPAEMNEVAGPDSPPFAEGDGVAIVDEPAAPGSVQLDDGRSQGDGEKCPWQLFDREDLPEERAHGRQGIGSGGMDEVPSIQEHAISGGKPGGRPRAG